MVKIKYPLHRLKYCRKCLNSTFGMNLQRKDVYIYSYPMECSSCGESKNIIYKVRFPYNVILHFKIKDAVAKHLIIECSEEEYDLDGAANTSKHV